MLLSATRAEATGCCSVLRLDRTTSPACLRLYNTSLPRLWRPATSYKELAYCQRGDQNREAETFALRPLDAYSHMLEEGV